MSTSDDLAAWRARTRITLRPMAAPSSMGMLGLTISLLMVGAWQAGWYGTPTTPGILWPFTLAGGGIMQVPAAIAALRARDGVAVAVHTASGSFWLGWSVMHLLIATHVLPVAVLGTVHPSTGIWFVALCSVIAWTAVGAVSNSMFMSATLAVYSAGLALTAAAWFDGSLATHRVAGWLLVVAAALGWYTVGAILLEEAFGRTILPLGKLRKAANIPGAQPQQPISFPGGMPGVRVGQ